MMGSEVNIINDQIYDESTQAKWRFHHCLMMGTFQSNAFQGKGRERHLGSERSSFQFGSLPIRLRQVTELLMETYRIKDNIFERNLIYGDLDPFLFLRFGLGSFHMNNKSINQFHLSPLCCFFLWGWHSQFQQEKWWTMMWCLVICS